MNDAHKRLKKGEVKLIRTVEQLYPAVEVELSPADVDYYRSLGRWAMVLDRQSHKKDLTTEEATGHANRVRNCQTMAQQLGVVLPVPVENTNRQDGEFQFSFDQDECRYHWFVDGLEANASGYTASPWARMKLWRAAKTARLLRRLGCPPQAVLIGELTRFFRDQRQFMDWYHILKDSGARIHIYGCPELTPENEGMILPMLLCQTDALSAWLKKQNRMARETRRGAGKLFKKRSPFGLSFNLDETSRGYLREVYPDAVEWPLIQRALDKVCEGELKNRPAVMAWLVREAELAGVPAKRIPRSRAWLTNLLQSEVLRGVYYQYDESYTPCRIEQAEGDMNSDWDYTPNGYRRYMREEVPDEAVRFDILLAPNEEIPPEKIALVQSILSRQGRPRNEVRSQIDREATNASLLKDGLIRCAICGSAVQERAPRVFKEEHNRWSREEDVQLVDLLHQGKSNREIAEALGFKEHRVDNRRYRMQYQGSDFDLDMARLNRFWDDPFLRRPGVWHLYCTCLANLTAKATTTVDRAREFPEAQHVRKRNGSLTLALEPLVWDALINDTAIDMSDLPLPAPADVSVLEAESGRIAHRIKRVQDAYEEEDWTMFTQAEARTRLAELRGDLASVQAKIAAAKGSMLDSNDRQDRVAWEETRVQLSAMVQSAKFQQNHEGRRRVMELCLSRVTVNLETGEFQAETNLNDETRRLLCGAVLSGTLPNVENVTNRGVGYLISNRWVLRGMVRLAA